MPQLPVSLSTFRPVFGHEDEENQIKHKLNGWIDVVADFGAMGDGVTDDSTAIQTALDAAKTGGGNVLFPPGKSFLVASQVTAEAPSFDRVAVWGYGAEIKTSGAISGLKITGGDSYGGVSVYGLRINHSNNASATYGYQIEEAWNARLRDCSVQAYNVDSAYAAFALLNGDPTDSSTASFWTLLDGCWTRAGGGVTMPVGVLLKGAQNATTIRGGGLNSADTMIHHTFYSGQTATANALLVDGVAFENYTTAYHQENASGAVAASGARLVNNRFEQGTTVFSLTGTTTQPSVPTYLAGNTFISDAGTYLNNPNDLHYTSLDTSVTPSITGDGMHWEQATFIQSLAGADHPLTVQTAGGNRGIVLRNTSGQPVAELKWTGSGTESELTGAAGGMHLEDIRAIAGTSVKGENLRGSATFSTSGTVSVSFGTDEPDASYYVALSGDANETFWVTSKVVGGFTLNSSNASSTATVDWILIR